MKIYYLMLTYFPYPDSNAQAGDLLRRSAAIHIFLSSLLRAPQDPQEVRRQETDVRGCHKARASDQVFRRRDWQWFECAYDLVFQCHSHRFEEPNDVRGHRAFQQRRRD